MGEAERAALAGKRIVVTRAAEQAGELLKSLHAFGAETILLSVIRILPPEDCSFLDDAVRRLREFDWVLFTSQNAVRAVRERCKRLQLSLRSGHHMPVAGAVGETTAAEATKAGFEVVHVASRPVGMALVEDLAKRLSGKSVLLPRSDRANPDVLKALQECGARVSEVVAYRTVAEERQSGELVARALSADAVLFFSPSAVDGFESACGPGSLAEFAKKGLVLSSGPVTLAALHSKGMTSAVAAKDPSVAAIVAALANSFRAREMQVSSETRRG